MEGGLIIEEVGKLSSLVFLNDDFISRTSVFLPAQST
jgi:hypothetical protein